MVARDIALAELTGGLLRVAHASTAGTAQLVRQAKDRGLNVTSEVTPHNLTLSEETVLGNSHGGSPFGPLTASAYDTSAKVYPPLRSRRDVEAMVQALKDGTIDVIATDHAPHNRVHKLCTFEEAASGLSVLETALGSLMSLVHAGDISMPLLLEKLTVAPARFLGRLGAELGTLRDGAPADITIFDPEAEWVVDTGKFASKGKNTPLDGATLKGQVVATIVGGEVVFSATPME